MCGKTGTKKKVRGSRLFSTTNAIILKTRRRNHRNQRTLFFQFLQIMDVLAAMCEISSKQQRDGDGETSEETEMYVVLSPC